MKPVVLVESVKISDGKELRLVQHDSDFSIKVNSAELMNSRMHGSEEALARLACEEIKKFPDPKILMGGLGMGFTLRAALDVLPQKSQVMVAELIPAVVRWNQGVLAHLARKPLTDRRVKIHETDVARMIQEGKETYSAILLDVDNGPESLFQKGNDRLYSKDGLRAAYHALQNRGVLAVWSAVPARDFTRRLHAAGFTVKEIPVSARSGQKAGGHHWIWLAKKHAPADPSKTSKPARRY